MNSWRSRIGAGALGAAVALAHSHLSADVPNTDLGMFLYHWSAGCAEFLLVGLAPLLLQGKLCEHIQNSCLASIYVNLIGWLAYTAYAPPVFYNIAIGVISCGQILLLLMGGKHVDYSRLLGYSLVRGLNPRRPKLNFKKAQ